jgi:hypothetical protein
MTYTPGGAGLPLSASDGSTTYGGSAHYAPQGGLAYLQNGTNLYATYISNDRLQLCWMYATTGSALSWNSTQCTGSGATGTILDLKYNFNLGAGDNGNVVGITNDRDSTRSQKFTYDSLNRISVGGTVNTSGTNCWGEQYGYDAWGNLKTIGFPSQYNSSCLQPDNLNVSVTNNQITSHGQRELLLRR